MSTEHKLSLPAAILININIMLGAGVFLNSVILAKRAALFGCLAYAIIGIMILPLILSIAQILTIHPAGGFYIFARKEITTFWGFVSAWSYFTGKLASAGLIIHTSILLCQSIIPFLAQFNPFVLDVLLLSLFVALNMFNMQTGSQIQRSFLVLKMIPISFIVLTGLFYLSGDFITPQNMILSGIPSTLPLVLYAILGFEATCSLSSKIKDAQRNGPKAIYISYAIVISLLILYQFFFYLLMGPELAAQSSYLEAFPALLAKLFPTMPLLQHKLEAVLHLSIAASAVGGSYGIIFSNNWNLYTLAQHGHIIGSSFLTRLNKHQIPFACVFVEGILCLVYLFVSQAKQIPLQQISAFGSVIGYSLSVIALVIANIHRPQMGFNPWIARLGLVSCTILLAACIYNFMFAGFLTLVAYLTILGMGIGMYYYKHNQSEVTIN